MHVRLFAQADVRERYDALLPEELGRKVAEERAFFVFDDSATARLRSNCLDVTLKLLWSAVAS